MSEKAPFNIGRAELSIAVSVAVTLLACTLLGTLGVSVQALAASTGAVMCTQTGGKASWKAGLTRLAGVVVGGAVGIAIVAADNALGLPVVFDLLCGAGVLLCLLLCGLFRFHPIQARVSSLTLLLVVLALNGEARFGYALGRFIGTLFGAVVALLVSMLFSLTGDKNNEGTLKS